MGAPTQRERFTDSPGWYGDAGKQSAWLQRSQDGFPLPATEQQAATGSERPARYPFGSAARFPESVNP
jgi:hypothetical protein